MFHELTEELLDLTATETGVLRAPLAMTLDACCCCSCCTCIAFC